MNRFTELSINLANREDYVDRLSSVYPMAPGGRRPVSPALWAEIQ